MKFYVVVREKVALNPPDKNVRYEHYQQAVDRASELASTTNEPYVILVAFERITPVFQVKRELLSPGEAI